MYQLVVQLESAHLLHQSINMAWFIEGLAVVVVVVARSIKVADLCA